MKAYLTISTLGEDEFVEKRSTFIGAIFPVTSHDEAVNFVKIRKEAHREARHTVWAYLLKDGVMRCSDDGEPQGTGGQPVLEVIKRSGVCDVCIAVTRYFGGTLLGAGGLIRAYTNGAVIALSASTKVEVSHCIMFAIKMDYNQYEIVLRLLPQLYAEILETFFTEAVEIKARIRKEDFETLESKLMEASAATLKIEDCEEAYAAMPPKEN